MQEPAIPPDENARQAALNSLYVLGTPPEERFDRITRTVQRLFDVPIVLISLIDANRQWFKSCQGLSVSETPRSISFCGHAILQDTPLIIPDALRDERFADNPLVTDAPHIRFYAGFQLRHPNGSRLGTLCLIDRRPRHLVAHDIDTLNDMRAWAEGELSVLNVSVALRIKEEAEARLNAIMNGVEDGIITINEVGLIESLNYAAERIFGYSLDEVKGRNVSLLMPEAYHFENDGDAVAEWSDMCGVRRELTARRRDGAEFPAELTVSEVMLAERRIFAGVVRDVGDLKRTERALRDTSLLQQAILDSANLTIISTDMKGVILTFNVTAQEMLGYVAEDIVGKATLAILHDSHEVMRRAAELSKELETTVEPGFETFVAKARIGHSDENEWTYRRKDGTSFPVLLTVTALEDADGVIAGFLAIGQDITERTKVERMKREFISTVSHELRTPLTSIRGALGLIAGDVAGEVPDQMRSLVDIAYKNSDRLTRLVDDLLDMEKIESGKLDITLGPVELMPLLEQTLEGNKSYGEQLHVRFELTDSVPDIVVRADSGRLMQVLTNLLSNAAKFSPGGDVVHVAVSRMNEKVRIAVSDHGPGIPDEFKKHIFEKFSQADSSDTRQIGGSGLGLSISRALMECMHGSIGFESDAGKGATFHVDIPEWRENLAAHPYPARSSYRRRVLICEDDYEMAGYLGGLLDKAGFSSDIANNATHAKWLVSNGRYVALLLDHMMPEQDGVSLVRELRRQHGQIPLPVIVVSASAEQAKAEMEYGCEDVLDWLPKPVDAERLLDLLRDAAARATLPRILYVEDNKDDVGVVSALLEGLADITFSADMDNAKFRLAREDFDLVILDLLLPDGFGTALLPHIKNANDEPVPVIIYSAHPVSKETAGRVVAALVKSETSGEQLVSAVSEQLNRSAHQGSGVTSNA